MDCKALMFPQCCLTISASSGELNQFWKWAISPGKKKLQDAPFRDKDYSLTSSQVAANTSSNSTNTRVSNLQKHSWVPGLKRDTSTVGDVLKQ